MLIDEKESGIDSRELLRELAAGKIQTRPLWQPIHRSPAHDTSGSPACPNSDALHSQAISLPCSVGLTRAAQDHVIETIASLLGKPKVSDPRSGRWRRSIHAMDIDDLFHSPADRIAAFAEMQLHLYRHDASLQDYFDAASVGHADQPPR